MIFAPEILVLESSPTIRPRLTKFKIKSGRLFLSLLQCLSLFTFRADVLSSKMRSMSEKLKYVLTFNHPGREKCTRATLWGTYREFIGTYGALSVQIGLKRRLG